MILQECFLSISLLRKDQKMSFLFNFFHWHIIINGNGVSDITSLVFVFNFVHYITNYPFEKMTLHYDLSISWNTFSRCFNSSFSNSSVEHIKITLSIKLFNVPVYHNFGGKECQFMKISLLVDFLWTEQESLFFLRYNITSENGSFEFSSVS